jgi:hypothetical protein
MVILKDQNYNRKLANITKSTVGFMAKNRQTWGKNQNRGSFDKPVTRVSQNTSNET